MGPPYGFSGNAAKIQLYLMPLLDGVQIIPVLGRQRHVGEDLNFLWAVMQIANIERYHNDAVAAGAAGILTIAKKNKTVFATGG